MRLSKISNLNDLAIEKAALQRRIDKHEDRLGKSYDRAKKHLRQKFSFAMLVKSAVGKVFSLNTLVSHPATYFKIGSMIGKRLFAKKK